MPDRTAPVCDCGADLRERDDCDAFATFFDGFGGNRADLHVECPDCGDVLEMEISVITNYGG